MIQIINKTRSPLPLNLKSTSKDRIASNQLTTKIIPGMGKGKNNIKIEDEQFTESIKILEKKGLIKINKI